MIEYRILDSVEEFEKVVDLEMEVWGTFERHTLPSSHLRAISVNGGVSVGAYDNDRLVGFAVGFPGFRNGDVYLWSHMAGVKKSHQDQNIGFQLKQQQRLWAIENGYKEIRWTFDPIVRGNANFNFNRLGVISNVYHIDFYGSTNDSINTNTPSDRLEVRWLLDSPPVVNRSSGHKPDQACPNYLILDQVGETHPEFIENQDVIGVYIPRRLQNPIQWRLSVREIFTTAFKNGYQAINFTSQEDGGIYHLQKSL